MKKKTTRATDLEKVKQLECERLRTWYARFKTCVNIPGIEKAAQIPNNGFNRLLFADHVPSEMNLYKLCGWLEENFGYSPRWDWSIIIYDQRTKKEKPLTYADRERISRLFQYEQPLH